MSEMKTKTFTVNSKSLKDIIWATLTTAAERVSPGKTALVEFEVNGCKVECIVRKEPKGE